MSEGRWALVVGASRGLGLGLAAELQRRGWNVIATVRDAAGERRLQKLADKPGGEIRVERLDINDDAGIAALRRRLDGTVFDLVFVNAGIAPHGRADAVGASREEAAAIFMTNAVAPMRVARAFLDRVRNGPGIVAFMSSGLGSVAKDRQLQRALQRQQGGAQFLVAQLRRLARRPAGHGAGGRAGLGAHRYGQTQRVAQC
jgi:NAD(P)-dependent dehydrogenase (short-subunit alcohol dehydrogenase family)